MERPKTRFTGGSIVIARIILVLALAIGIFAGLAATTGADGAGVVSSICILIAAACASFLYAEGWGRRIDERLIDIQMTLTPSKSARKTNNPTAEEIAAGEVPSEFRD